MYLKRTFRWIDLCETEMNLNMNLFVNVNRSDLELTGQKWTLLDFHANFFPQPEI